jgi:hypothetical protein
VTYSSNSHTEVGPYSPAEAAEVELRLQADADREWLADLAGLALDPMGYRLARDLRSDERLSE